MKVSELVEKLNLSVVTGEVGLDREITGGYTSDLLSDVMANAKAGQLWITLQIHQNTIAVATLNELSAICLVNNRTPDEGMISKAKEEGVPVLVSDLTAFVLSGKMYQLGIGAEDA